MRLPPLNALRAFEAAARLGSFQDAAAELNVTPAAISHQIRGLEEDLGIPLFNRLARGVEPTAAARNILPDISRGFAHFSRGIGALSGGELAGPLVVSSSRSFATLWLVPRLADFLVQFPEIQVSIMAADSPPDVLKGEADIRIPYGKGDYPGLSTELLLVDTIFPVAAPQLLNRLPIRSFTDLKHHVLLQDIDIGQDEPTMTWRRWLRDAGITGKPPAGMVEFNESVLLTQAAVHGAGVALGRLALVGQYLKTGQLVRPLKVSRPSDYSYYTVTSEAGRARPRVQAFLRWLEREVRRDTEDRPL